MKTSIQKQPHIIIFNPDQWRGDVMGHLGNPVAVTPNLDRMVATDAVSFRYAFCQNPVCTPSRCSFMSGWYPHVRGHRTMFHMMQPGEPVLLKYLKDAGYFVWWGGKNDLVSNKHGFSSYCDVKYQPEKSSNKLNINQQQVRGELGSDTYYSFYVGKLETSDPNALYEDRDWANVRGAIEQIKQRPIDQPLCIYLPLTYPHPPYAVEDPWFSEIDRALIPDRIPSPADWSGKPAMTTRLAELLNMKGWSEERWSELRSTYYGMCSRVDHQLGMLVNALKQEGIYDDTAIFFFSDHGDFTGDYGLVEKTQNTFEDCLVNVPFIIKPSANIEIKPGIRDAMVELVDFVATIEDMIDLDLDYTHFGKSLLPLLANETGEHRDAVFAEGGRLHGESHCMEQAQRSHDPTFLYYPRSLLQRSDGPEHTKATMIRTKDYKYIRRAYEADELYCLQQDPQELTNRIEDPAYSGILAELKDRMLTFYQTTCDAVPFQRDNR